MKFESFMVVET